MVKTPVRHLRKSLSIDWSTSLDVGQSPLPMTTVLGALRLGTREFGLFPLNPLLPCQDTSSIAGNHQKPKSDAETKRHILSTVGSNLTLKDKMLSIEARRPFSLLDDSGCGVRSEKVPLKPRNDGSAVEPIHGREATCPSLLVVLDEVGTLIKDETGAL